ncbi:MAG: quinoprotein dehydrogenase-associated putative ABC transporter substrate-binding protein [Gammaproteobacteria bacterium]
MNRRKSVYSGLSRPRWSWVGAIAAGALCSFAAVAGPEDQDQRKALKVCADPYSLPSSNKEQQGFENKIAQLFAGDLKLTLEYTWFPQRIGFIRNTLRNNDSADGRYKCDLVMGVPANFELAATTKPYYRSTWTMVYVKGRGWDDVKSQEDLVKLPVERKKALRIGLFDRSPAAMWLIKNDMMENIIPYPIMSGDARAYPGEIIEKDLVADKINLTFVWGPIAGYFAKRVRSPEIAVIPMHSEPGIRFDFSIAMAVRFGEKDWKQRIQALIDERRERIRAILAEYGVPLLED